MPGLEIADGLAASEKPERMYIFHPTTGAPVTDENGEQNWIDLYYGDSAVGKRVDNDAIKARAQKVQRTGVAALTEFRENEATDKLVALTHDWYLKGLLNDNPKVSRANARELYSIPALSWLRAQVNVWAGDLSNFMKGSKETSKPSPEDTSSSESPSQTDSL